jgi:hypothetical protein
MRHLKPVKRWQAKVRGYKPFSHLVPLKDAAIIDGMVLDMIDAGRKYHVVKHWDKLQLWAKPPKPDPKSVTHKVCSLCRKKKTRDNFTTGNAKGGLSAECGPCRREKDRKANAAKTAARKAAIRAIAEPCTKCMETGKLRIGRPTSPAVWTCQWHLIAALKRGEDIAYTDGIK